MRYDMRPIPLDKKRVLRTYHIVGDTPNINLFVQGFVKVFFWGTPLQNQPFVSLSGLLRDKVKLAKLRTYIAMSRIVAVFAILSILLVVFGKLGSIKIAIENK